MTALSTVQNVWRRLGLTAKPSTLFGSEGADIVEIRDLLQECADQIREESAWEKLSTIATITGDGSTSSFDLPADYEWMHKDGNLWSSAVAHAFAKVVSRDQWLYQEVQDFGLAYNTWIIYGDQIHIRPAPANGETVKYFYQRNTAVLEADGTTRRVDFGADDHTFALDERLLGLCLIWNYRKNNALSYAEDMDTYQKALERLIARDRGPQVLMVGGRTRRGGATAAYPRSLPHSA